MDVIHPIDDGAHTLGHVELSRMVRTDPQPVVMYPPPAMPRPCPDCAERTRRRALRSWVLRGIALATLAGAIIINLLLLIAVYAQSLP